MIAMASSYPATPKESLKSSQPSKYLTQHLDDTKLAILLFSSEFFLQAGLCFFSPDQPSEKHMAARLKMPARSRIPVWHLAFGISQSASLHEDLSHAE